MLDLGAIGKGYAVERGAEFLREAGVTSALFHGGTSTICAIGHPPDKESWRVAIEQPPAGAKVPAPNPGRTPPQPAPQAPAIPPLGVPGSAPTTYSCWTLPRAV